MNYWHTFLVSRDIGDDQLIRVTDLGEADITNKHSQYIDIHLIDSVTEYHADVMDGP